MGDPKIFAIAAGAGGGVGFAAMRGHATAAYGTGVVTPGTWANAPLPAFSPYGSSGH